ncbi:hypothetical protein DFJ63DRAFT_313089 [Scheffersomyces coipomensis]|uniref:uncharacterized protein n=1 Tax=Scheffersomyces coipomensis TaxID=1788519 RepID=UPI00315D3A1A
MKLSLIPVGIVLGLWSALINAVSYDNAFNVNKELIHYNYYKFSHSNSFEVIDSSNIIGYNLLNQFININVTSGDINWLIQDTTEFNQFVIIGSNVYLYSDFSHTINIVELKTGILIRSIEVIQPITKVINFFNKGLLVVQSDGTLHFINDRRQSQIHLDYSIKSEFVYQQLNGFMYIITYNGHLIKLNSNYQIVNQFDLSANKLSQFKDFILITDSNQIYKLVESGETFDVKSISSSFQNVKIISPTYFYNTESNNKVNIYTIKNNKLESVWDNEFKGSEITNVELTPFALSDYLIVTKANGSKQVFDLTDLLIIDDPYSIKEIKVKSDLLSIPGTVDFIISSSDDIPHLITINDALDGAIYDINDGSLVQTIVHSTSQFLPIDASTVSLIVDKPSSKQAINQVNHLLNEGTNIILWNWVKRTYRHLGELGKYFTSFVSSSSTPTGSEDDIGDLEDDFGFVKYVIFYDQISKALLAINSKNGEVEWKSYTKDIPQKLLQINGNIIVVSNDSVLELDPLDGIVLSTKPITGGKEVIKVQAGEEESYIVETEQSFESISSYTQDIYLFKSNEDKIEGHKLIKGSTKSIATWNFIPQQDETIITAIAKDVESSTVSVGIPLANKSILYKYLNPNVIAVVTKSHDQVLKIYLIDGITGNLLSVFEHTNNEIIDFTSINIIIDDNWVIYTYFIKSPRLEQRINVIDLFDSNKSIKKSGNDLISSFTHNSTINSYSKKSFAFPERIINLSSTKSEYGITLKSILVLTESGYLMEIPKYILNSRRIDNRPLVPDDYISDFKVSPYEPIINLNTLAILNHKHKLILNQNEKGTILIKPTHFESTSVLCYLNKFNYYCGLVQPSKSFDTLGHGFERVKLLGTIVALFAVYIVTKPFVSKKRLNDQWLYS